MPRCKAKNFCVADNWSDAAWLNVTKDVTAATQKQDAVAGGIRFIPFQVAVWNLNLRADLDMRSPKRLIRSVVGYCNVGLSISHVDIVGPVRVGLAAAARRRHIRPHQSLVPLADSGIDILPLPQVAGIDHANTAPEPQDKADALHL